MSRIVTFYSYKGGVGRSMALANAAVMLARRGLRVLAVDWDLEAPGLERYFDYFELSLTNGGLLPFLVEQLARLEEGEPAHPERYRDHLWSIDVDAPHPLSLLGSGRAENASYIATLEQFSWNAFFERGGGDFLEQLRRLWRDDFDVVLIDSRTGMSDAGGICTIQMPDVLVAMFTMNYQSVLGVADVVKLARASRQRLAYDRMALTVLPVPSRFFLGVDVRTSHEWMERAESALEECFRDWLPQGVSPRLVLERLKIPHDDTFAFGERLAVVERGEAPSALVVAYERIAALLASDFRDVDAALGALPRDVASRSLPAAASEPGDGSYDVFVSYAQAGSVLSEWNRRFVATTQHLVGAELGRPVQFFVDLEDPAEARLDEQRERLRRSRALLAILTPQYLASSWCLAEWQAFEDREHAELRRLVVPVALRGASSFPTRFRERAMIDGSNANFAASVDATMRPLAIAAAKALADVLRGTSPRIAQQQHQQRQEAVEHAAILFLPANPIGSSPLAVEVEAKEISAELRGSAFERAFQLQTRHWSTLAELKRAMQDVSATVVHFSGRGANDGVYYRGANGLPKLLAARQIAEVFSAKPPRLVVLGACYAEAQADALARRAECVIGIEPSSSDGAARMFSTGLYRALASGASVQTAFDRARAVLTGAEPLHLLTRPGVDATRLFIS
jgi:MinD-like ATPase involved in chromosome partitioning or flagellar assembly